jgi:hypothetical protein
VYPSLPFDLCKIALRAAKFGLANACSTAQAAQVIALSAQGRNTSASSPAALLQWSTTRQAK